MRLSELAPSGILGSNLTPLATDTGKNKSRSPAEYAQWHSSQTFLGQSWTLQCGLLRNGEKYAEGAAASAAASGEDEGGWGRGALDLFSGGQKYPICPSREKFYTVVLKGRQRYF